MDPTRLRIMIVEDKAVHAEAIRRAFEAAGTDVGIQVAGTLREYRESVAASAPDIVLADLNLPDGRAVEVLTSPPESGPFPILIMTGCGTEQVAVEALKSGALDYIIKSPEAFADMPRTVARALREWTMLQERKQAEEKVAASLREKEVLLREIHHRVKNNMQIISSLLRLQSRSIEDEKMREIFNENQSRIRSMSLIHEKLYESKDFSRIDFSDYIGKMVTHLFIVYRMNPGDVHFKVEAKDIHLDITRAIPCGLIINELVSNALKYAFPSGKKGDLLIRMNKDESGKYHLLVKDTGSGLLPNFDIRTTETLGFQIVNDLVKQLDGTIELKRDEGTEFRIVF